MLNKYYVRILKYNKQISYFIFYCNSKEEAFEKISSFFYPFSFQVKVEILENME